MAARVATDLEGIAARVPLRSLPGSNAIRSEGGLTLLQPEVVSATAEVRGVSYVGRYGIRIEWADGTTTAFIRLSFFAR